MQTQWFKQFWPWFLIALPSAAVIASFSTLYIAINNAPEIVIDDYYKEGKAINLELARDRHAKELGIALQVSLLANAKGTELLLRHVGEKPTSAGALQVSFYHPTLGKRDISELLTADAQGDYRAELSDDLNGKWRLSVESLTDQWRLQRVFNFPGETSFTLAP